MPTARYNSPPPAPTTRSSLNPSRELWRLRGAHDHLRALAIETSFGFTFALELDTEIVLQHLQPSLDTLLEYADRIETALLTQGWTRVTSSSHSLKEPR